MSEYSYDLALVDGQIDEMQKIAWLAGVLRKGTASRGALIGAGTAALGGGALGAATSDPEQGLAGRIQGGISGAITGGMLGAGAGTVATKAGRRWIGQGAKAQAHGLTGWVPGSRKAGKGFFGQRMSQQERAKALEGIGITAPKGRLSHGQAMGQIREGRITSRLPQGVQEHLADLSVARHKAQQEQVSKGLTSAPGFVKGMIKDPKGTAKTGILAAGGLGAAMNVGFSAPEVYDAAKEKDIKRLGGSLAETGFYGVSGGIPMLGSMALGSAIRRGGQLPGDVVERLKQRRGEQPTPSAPRGAGRQLRRSALQSGAQQVAREAHA